MSLGERKMAMRYRLKPKNLSQNYLLDTKRTLEQEPFQQASLLDNTSLGAYYDFIDAGGQLNYEDFLQYQSIPQSDRPLTGQTPTEQLFGIQRQEVNQGGSIETPKRGLVDGPGSYAGKDKYVISDDLKKLIKQKIKLRPGQKWNFYNPKTGKGDTFGVPKGDPNYNKARYYGGKQTKDLVRSKEKYAQFTDKDRERIREKVKNFLRENPEKAEARKIQQREYRARPEIKKRDALTRAIYEATPERKQKQKESRTKRQVKRGIFPTGNNYKENVWRDLYRSSQVENPRWVIADDNKNILTTDQYPKKDGKTFWGEGNYKKVKFLDTETGQLIKLDNNIKGKGISMEKYLDSNFGKETYNNALNTYRSKDTMKNYKIEIGGKQQNLGTVLRNRIFTPEQIKARGDMGTSVFHVSHDEGVGKNWWKSRVTFGDANFKLRNLDRTLQRDLKIAKTELDKNKVLKTYEKEVRKLPGGIISNIEQGTFGIEPTEKSVIEAAAKKARIRGTEGYKKLRKSIADSLRKAGFKCKFGGSVGGSVGCDDPMSYLDDIKRSQNMAASGSPEGKARSLNKFRRAKTLLTGTLGPYALAGEALFSVPFALYDYATGADKNEIISNLTLGLGGKSQEEQLKEIYGDNFGLALKAVETDERLQSLDRLQEGTRGQRIRSKGKFDIAEKQFEEQISPFMIDGQLDQAAFEENIKQEELGREKYLQEKAKRAEERKDTLTGLEIPGIDLTRETYQDAGFVDKLKKGAKSFDPRNLPYYGQRALKGLMAGTEMAVKFPVAAGAAISETLRQKPSMGTLRRFGEAMQPTATEYLSEKTGLENLIKKAEARIAEQNSGAKTVGDILQLGSELIPPATGYIKLLEDSGSKLYKVIRDGRAGKEIRPEDFEEVAEILSEKGVSRRDFMKVVGGSSVYGLAKYIGLADAVKIAEKVKPIRMLAKTSTKMPAWFPNFASKILDDTDTVFKQIDEDIVEITNKNLPDLEINKYADGRWEISGTNEYGKKYAIDYEPPTILEDGTSYPGDFTVIDSVPVRSGPDDVDFDSELVETIDDVLGGTSKLEEWTKGVKKKDLTKGEKRVIEAEGRAEADYDAWRESEDFVDE